MKKSLLILVVIFCTSISAFAQNTFNPTGNAGMGTTTLTDQLTLLKADNTNYNLHLFNGGGSAKGLLINGGNTGSDASLLQVSDFANANNFFTVTDGNSYFQNGNLGVGTSSPAARLHSFGTTEQLRLGYDGTNYASFSVNSGGTLVVIPTSGGISFGASVTNVVSSSGTTTSPAGNGQTALALTNSSPTSGNTVGLKFNNGSVVYSAIENIYTTRTTGAEDGTLTFTTVGGGAKAERMRITPAGSVVIGTLDPHGFKLAVNGNAIATSMTVQLNSNWPDYVFNPGYQLPSLAEVEKYVDKNHHLPEIPSEQEIEHNGQNLGEINSLLLKKVEELTLYLVEQKKQINNLQEQMNELKKQLANQSQNLTKN